MPYHYSRRLGRILKAKFEFFRFRFHFKALEPVHFPAGKSGNVIRGALGRILRDTASPAAYARLFEPGSQLGRAPSGLADWPRPFILRADTLDGRTVSAGEQFCFDVHVFDPRPTVLTYFHEAFSQFGAQGIGPGHGRVALQRTQQVDLNDHAGPVRDAEPLAVDLAAADEPVRCVEVRFLSPTELKSEGVVAPRPEFAILFARLRDRISTLRDLYGSGPLEIDFRGLGERACAIQMSRCDVRWEKFERKSGHTGQVHPLGGFTGSAEYQGELAEFLPWLRAARWVGVGRQTVWGKGDVRVV
jgi:CRISPR-associated endoribonuclease Cas6